MPFKNRGRYCYVCILHDAEALWVSLQWYKDRCILMCVHVQYLMQEQAWRYCILTCYSTLLLLLIRSLQNQFYIKMVLHTITIHRSASLLEWYISWLEEEDHLSGHPGHLIWPLPGLFFLVYVKSIVYQKRVHTLSELRQCITNADALITPQILQNTWRKFEYHLDICRPTRGAHIKLYYHSSKLRVFYIKLYNKIC